MRRGYRWQVVALLWLVCCLNYADRQSIFSIFPTLRREFGLNPVELGLIGSAFTWLYALMAPLAGFIGDQTERKRIILGSCLGWSVITAMTGLCAKLWQFVIVRALTGLGETFYFPAALSLMSDYHGPGTRSRALSLHQSGVYIGTILGGWLGGWFAERHGWRLGFYFFGGAGILLALVLFGFLREPRRGAAEAPDEAARAAGEPPPGVREVLRILFAQPTALWLMAVFLGANFVATIFLTWTPMFLVEKFGFTLTRAGLAGTLYIHLASALSVPLGGWLADRLARKLAGGRMLVQAAGLLIGAAFIGLIGRAGEARLALVAMALFGFCKGIYDSNIWASLYDVIEPRARATISGLMNTVGWGGGALGPIFVGFATRYGHHGSEAANMGAAIGQGGIIYVVGGVLLAAVAIGRGRRDRPPVS